MIYLLGVYVVMTVITFVIFMYAIGAASALGRGRYGRDEFLINCGLALLWPVVLGGIALSYILNDKQKDRLIRFVRRITR